MLLGSLRIIFGPFFSKYKLNPVPPSFTVRLTLPPHPPTKTEVSGCQCAVFVIKTLENFIHKHTADLENVQRYSEKKGEFLSLCRSPYGSAVEGFAHA